MLVSKEASGLRNRLNSIFFTESCRNAISQILSSTSSTTKILLPAYVGLSLEEGSGILDPVKDSNTHFEFYDIDANLDPDLESLASMLTSFNPTYVLVVNYFGFLCANRTQVFELLSEHTVCVIEDFAHLVEPLRGRRSFPQLSDFEVFSLHKTFGAGVGGGALLCKSINDSFKDTISSESLKTFVKSDLDYIAESRLRNYEYLKVGLDLPACDCVKPFFSDQRKPVLPLNFPLRIRNMEMRHELYETLVKGGIIPTALYHRLVDEIQSDRFPTSINISQTILNLPTHQDVVKADLDFIIEKVRNFCGEH